MNDYNKFLSDVNKFKQYEIELMINKWSLKAI